MRNRRRITKAVSIIWVLLFIFAVSLAQAQSKVSGDDAALPSLVEIYWHSSKTIVAPELTNPVMLDPEIAQAQIGYDTIEITGVERGETVLLGYVNGNLVSIRIRVVQRPLVIVPPSLLKRQAEMAQGTVSSNLELAKEGGSTSAAVLNGVSWSQLAGSDGHLNLAGQFESSNYAGGREFNVLTASAFYYDPRLEIRAIDFNANLVGSGSQPNLASYSFNDFVTLRGVSLTLNRGNNQYLAFGGTTLPYYYLSLGSTRDVAGFSYLRKQTDNLNFFASTTYVNAPLDFLGLATDRRNNVMQTVGSRWKINRNWAVQGVGGISNHGGMLRGEFSYTGSRMTAYSSGIMSSVLFPMNQLGALLTGTSSLKSGWAYKNTNWLTETLTYQHVNTQAFAGVTTSGNSDYLSPGLAVKVGKRQDVSFNYSYSHSAGGFSSESATGNRLDSYWHFLFTRNVSNSLQVSVGSLQDPLQINSEDQYLFSDTFGFPVKGGHLYLAFSHDRTNPSLVSKLRSELGLLSPQLQNLFISDPVSFVNSPNLPPEVRALLNAQNPIGTSISAAGQFHIGTRLNFGPSFSLARSTNGTTDSWTPYFGYGLAYRVSHSIQLTSSLTNQWVLANNNAAAQRTSVFAFGITKAFMASPEILLTPLRHHRVIEGRVFRDNSVKGVFKAGDPGFAGLQVRLETGETATTDSQGRYKFIGVSGGLHQVSLDVNQFGQPIRMTTKAVAEVDLIRSNLAVVNFGVVDFARLLGAVFNDLRFEGKRQPDSKEMPGIHLILDDGKTKRTIVSESGEYEVDNLPPGDYTLQVDTSTVAANYVLPQDSFQVHVSPISSVIVDVPVYALRSISGRVFLKVPISSKTKPAEDGNAADYKLVPMAGIQLKADASTATTDENGNFLLRHLPAGDLTISIVPVQELPAGMKVPSGPVHMPAEPIEVTGATIVISNPDLVPYLTGKTAGEVRGASLDHGN